MHNFTSKIWSPTAGFWASVTSWVWMFLRLRIAFGGTGLNTCLHLVAPFSSKCLTCFMGETCRSSNSFCSFGAVQRVKNKEFCREGKRFSKGTVASDDKQWEVQEATPAAQAKFPRVVSILKASSLKIFLMHVWHRNESLSLMQLQFCLL